MKKMSRRTRVGLSLIVIMIVAGPLLVACSQCRPTRKLKAGSSNVLLEARAGARIELVVPPRGENAWFASVRGKETERFLCAKPGNSPTTLWSGAKSCARLLGRPEDNGAAIIEYTEVSVRPEIARVRIFDRTGEEISSYETGEATGSIALLKNGELLASKRTKDGHFLLLLDQKGKEISRAGPFIFRKIESNFDGSRVLLDLCKEVAGGGHFTPFRASTGLLIVDVRSGKTLHRLPPVDRSRLSPKGDVLVTVDGGKLTTWVEGKKQRAVDLPTRSTWPVFSSDGSYVGFALGASGYRVCQSHDLRPTMTVEPPVDYLFSSNVSISSSGRLLILSFPGTEELKTKEWRAHLYEADGKQIWVMDFPLENGKGTLRALSLSPDGHVGYFVTPCGIFCIRFPEPSAASPSQ